MKIYFTAPLRACGYSKQIVIDIDARTIKKGYFLIINKCIRLSAQDFEQVFEDFIRAGYKKMEG